MGITACTVPPWAERCPMSHICFHYTFNRPCRKQGRKQTQPSNGFIPVFPWPLIKIEYFASQRRCCSLQGKYRVFSYLLSRPRLIPRLTRVLYSCLGTGRLLAAIFCRAQTLLCVASAPPPNRTVLGVPHRDVSNPQTSRRQDWSSPALLNNWKEKDHQQQVGNELIFWGLGSEKEQNRGGKGEKTTQSPKDHFPPAHIKGWRFVPQWPEKQTLICIWTRRSRLLCNSDS